MLLDKKKVFHLLDGLYEKGGSDRGESYELVFREAIEIVRERLKDRYYRVESIVFEQRSPNEKG